MKIKFLLSYFDCNVNKIIWINLNVTYNDRNHDKLLL